MRPQVYMAQLVLERVGWKLYMKEQAQREFRDPKLRSRTKDLMEAEIFGFEKGAFTGN